MKPLPGEISGVRTQEKSAEAVVAMRPAERQEERRAKATNSEALWSVVHRGNIAQTSAAAGVRNTARCANPTRLSDAVAASGKGRGTPGGTHEPRTDSNAGGIDGEPSHEALDDVHLDPFTVGHVVACHPKRAEVSTDCAVAEQEVAHCESG